MEATTESAAAPASDQALWRELTAAETDAAFAAAWLALACRMVTGAVRGVLVMPAREGEDAVVVVWPTGARPEPGLVAAVQAALQDGRATVQPLAASPGVPAPPPTRLAYPVKIDDAVIAAAALDVAGPGGEARQAMRQVQWAAAWLRDHRRRRDDARHRQAGERTALALDLLAATLEAARFADACRISATELATRFGCERVSVGLRRHGHCRVAGISHSAQFGRAMNLVHLLAAAMDEAIDQHGPVLYPPAECDLALVTRAHAALAAGHGAGHVLSIPMFVRDRFAGAVTFERAPDRPFDQATLDLADAVVAILGPALLDKREIDRPLPLKFSDAVGRQAVHLFGPGHWGAKLALAALAASLAFAALARGPYRVAAEARLEGAVQRAIAAPFDGFIAEALVKAGDTVAAGQKLAALDDRDLVLERLRWLTERQQHLAEFDQALSQGKRAEAARFHAQTEEATAQMRLIDEQLAHTRLIAPFAGLVVSGDLSQSIGAPARRGDVLFEIAPLDNYRVVLRVHESQIADIHPGQHGTLLLASVTDLTLPMTVERVTPVAEAHDGRMLFQVDATLDAASPRLRPGMEGLGKIEIGRRRIVWIWFRSLLHWARVQSWAWLP